MRIAFTLRVSPDFSPHTSTLIPSARSLALASSSSYFVLNHCKSLAVKLFDLPGEIWIALWHSLFVFGSSGR